MELSTIILTFTGKRVDLLNPSPSDICIEDIAHSLAASTRFNGHTRVPVSVAQHCVLGSYLFQDSDGALAFLLHDAHEAYLGDLARPVRAAITRVAVAWGSKHGLRDDDLVELIAGEIDTRIEAAFGIKFSPYAAEIRRIDDLMLQVEGAALGIFPPLHNRLFDYRAPWGFAQAEAEFLARFHFLHDAVFGNPAPKAETITPEG